MTQPLTTDQLEELLEEELPCGGVRQIQVRRTCDRPAAVMALSHHDGRPMFKCLPCWQVWYRYCANQVAQYGVAHCTCCGKLCYEVEQLADYRPF